MAASYPTSIAIDHLRAALAADSDFRTWAGVATQAAALLRISKGSFITPPARPWVLFRRGGYSERNSGCQTIVKNGVIRLFTEMAITGANQVVAKENEAHEEANDKFEELLELVRTAAWTEVNDRRLIMRDLDDEGDEGLRWPPTAELADNTKPFEFAIGAASFAIGPEG